MPVLRVSHDGDGDWQFLCGGLHPDGGDDRGGLVCLAEIVERDESLNELAELRPSGAATRAAVGADWEIHDGMEDIVLDNVVEHGWHVMLVSGDEDSYGFAYSIGLSHTHGQPELVCFGLDLDVMHSMINAVGERIANGLQIADGDRIAGVIEGYDCILKRMQSSKFGEYLGYARWFYEGDDFEALQVVWPDKGGRFPWDPGYSGRAIQQPETW